MTTRLTDDEASADPLTFTSLEVCDTVNVDLRASTNVPTRTKLATVLGYYAAGDGGGGLFEWTPRATATDDGCWTINPTGHTGSGRWLRRAFDSTINVAWYGVTATSDLGAVINRAVAHFGSTPGLIDVPPGNYAIATQITLTTGIRLHLGAGYYTVNWPSNTDPLILFQDKVAIYGDGWNTIIEQPHSLFLAAPYSYWVGQNQNGQNDLEFRDFQVGKPNNPQTSGGYQQVLQLDNAQRVRVRNVYFNGTYGIAVQLGGASDTGHYSNVAEISDCYFHYVTDDTIMAAAVNSANFQFSNNVFDGGGSLDLEVNTATDSLNDFVIANNVFTGGGLLEIQSTDGTLANNGIVTGNVFDTRSLPSGLSTAHSGLLIARGNAILVTGNLWAGFADVAVEMSASNHITVADNHIQNVAQSPGFNPPPVSNDAAIVMVNGSTANTIRGNTVVNPNKGRSGVIEEDTSDYNIIYNNVFSPSSDGLEPFVYLVGAHSRQFDNYFNGRKVGGPPRRARRFVAASGSISATDDLIGVDSSGGVVTLTLPSPTLATVPSDQGALVFVIQNETGSAGTNSINISPSGSETINGVAGSYAITVAYGRATIYSDGTNWFAA